MPTRLLPLVSLLIQFAPIVLVGGAALLAAHLLRNSRAYRPYRRTCLAFASSCAFAALATLLYLAVPGLDRYPYDTLLNVFWLVLTEALTASLLWGARGLKESAGLLLIFASTAIVLVGDVVLLLPALPSLTEVTAAWTALGAAYSLPCWYLWRRYFSRSFFRTGIFSLKVALGLAVVYATIATLLFARLFWHGHHPTNLLPAFAWAGAYYIGSTLLGLGSLATCTHHGRGYFRRWLSTE